MDDSPLRQEELLRAWRSDGAHALARRLVGVARAHGADMATQTRIAAAVLAMEGEVCGDDVVDVLATATPPNATEA